jgi:hypothetical protein
VDPVSLIAAALAAGAVAGARNTATEAVRDSYTALKELVRRRLSERISGQEALARHETAPDQDGGVLEAELVAARASDDPAMVDATQQLLAMLNPAGTRAGKYAVDLSGALGVQVGDHNTQTNTFSTPPTTARS